ncbi:Ger(x)C family spore germination protein [Clostridium akagii]|uniref:Ger(x)C family spore germination protein n=1 Tax=Clostridium akagii TaxID=91623 RepID=UPI00047D4AF7|nr:Ger(x)C family spore germination protein [Clostridium akagii]
MKKYISVFIKIIVCIFIVINLTSCWGAHELNKLAIVMGVGIDKGKANDMVDITVQVAKVLDIKSSPKGSSGSVGGSDSGYLNLEEKGRSISQAVKNINRKINRKLFFSHNQVIILGKDAAEAGISKYIDFFLRYRENRLLVWVIVAKGSAAEMLDIKPGLETTPGRSIGELIRNQEEDTSLMPAVELKDFASRLMSKTTSPIAPIIEVSKEDKKKTVYLSETAVFKKDKMVGTLDKKETRGLLWVINKVKDGVITVSMPDDKDKVDIETTHVSSKITAEIKDNKPKMKIEIKQEGDLQEQTSAEDFANPKAFAILEKSEEDIIKEEVISSLKKSRELNADTFGFGDIIYEHYPKQWMEMEKNWDEIFQKIQVDVSVHSKINRTGRITKPIMSPDK